MEKIVKGWSMEVDDLGHTEDCAEEGASRGRTTDSIFWDIGGLVHNLGHRMDRSSYRSMEHPNLGHPVCTMRLVVCTMGFIGFLYSMCKVHPALGMTVDIKKDIVITKKLGDGEIRAIVSTGLVDMTDRGVPKPGIILRYKPGEVTTFEFVSEFLKTTNHNSFLKDIKTRTFGEESWIIAEGELTPLEWPQAEANIPMLSLQLLSLMTELNKHGISLGTLRPETLFTDKSGRLVIVHFGEAHTRALSEYWNLKLIGKLMYGNQKVNKTYPESIYDMKELTDTHIDLLVKPVAKHPDESDKHFEERQQHHGVLCRRAMVSSILNGVQNSKLIREDGRVYIVHDQGREDVGPDVLGWGDETWKDEDWEYEFPITNLTSSLEKMSLLS